MSQEVLPQEWRVQARRRELPLPRDGLYILNISYNQFHIIKVLAILQLLKDICVHEVLRVLDDLHEQHVRIVRVLAEVDQQGLAPMGGCRLAAGAVLGF